MTLREEAMNWLREEIRRDAAFGDADTLRDHYDGGCLTDPRIGGECSIVRSLAALLARVREEDCRAICDQCAKGVPVELDTLTSGEWVHENGEGCLADPIRARKGEA